MTQFTPSILTRAYHRYDLDNVLPIIARRVLDGDFASLADIGGAYGVDRDTAKRWRKRAVDAGLITPAAWSRGILKGRLSRIGAAGDDLNHAIAA